VLEGEPIFSHDEFHFPNKLKMNPASILVADLARTPQVSLEGAYMVRSIEAALAVMRIAAVEVVVIVGDDDLLGVWSCAANVMKADQSCRWIAVLKKSDANQEIEARKRGAAAVLNIAEVTERLPSLLLSLRPRSIRLATN
jgi:hypothetical protein